LLRALLAAGWIDLTPTEHPVPFVTESGWQVMKGTGPLRFRLPSEPQTKCSRRSEPSVRRSRTDARADAAASLSGADAALFAELRAARAELARGRGVPAYVIAPDATLAGIARARPTRAAELLAVAGMGPYR